MSRMRAASPATEIVLERGVVTLNVRSKKMPRSASRFLQIALESAIAGVLRVGRA